MNRLRVPVLLAFAFVSVAPLVACDMGLQAELNKKKAERYARAKAELNQVEQTRIKRLADSMPDPAAKWEGGARHPMVSWRGALAQAEDDAALIKLSEDYKGTPIAQVEKRGNITPQAPAADAAAFAKESHGFWLDMLSKNRSGMNRYEKFLQGYLKGGADNKAIADKESNKDFIQRPFLDEAAFELIFLHAVRFYLLERLPPQARWTTAFPYWQMAFRFPSFGNEGFSRYVTRLCRGSKVKESCKGVPHEYRAQAINKPYLEYLKGEIKSWRDRYDTEIYSKVLADLERRIETELKETPDLTEDPVLPGTYSDRAAAGGFTVVMSPKQGVWLHDLQLSETYEGKLPGDLVEKAGEKLTTMKDDPSNTVDFERVVLVAPGDLKAGDVSRVVRAFPNDIVRQFDLVGRRRIDESMRKTGTLLRLPAPDEAKTTSYQLQGEETKTYCDYLGVAGKPPIGRKSPGHYLVVDKIQVRAAKLNRDPETRELSVDKVDFTATAAERDKVFKWAAEHPGIVRFFFSGDYTYDEMLQWMSGILAKCEDAELALDERGSEKVTITCAKAHARDITLVVGVCRRGAAVEDGKK